MEGELFLMKIEQEYGNQNPEEKCESCPPKLIHILAGEGQSQKNCENERRGHASDQKLEIFR